MVILFTHRILYAHPHIDHINSLEIFGLLTTINCLSL